MGGFSSTVQQPQTGGGGKSISQGPNNYGGTVADGGNSDLQAMGRAAYNPNNPAPYELMQQQDAQQPINLVNQGGGDGLGGTGLSRNMPQPMGKGGRQTNSATSGQPRMGMKNQYPNTVGQWDNSQIQPTQQRGKGKGG